MKSTVVSVLALLFLPIVIAVSNVQHTVEDTSVTITYDGEPPFLINIRDNTNIGAPGGFLWATTHANTFSIDVAYADTPTFYYAVKDTTWSPTLSFTLDRDDCSVNQKTISLAQIGDERGDTATSFIDITQVSVQQVGPEYLQLDMRLNGVIPFGEQRYTWLLDTTPDQGNEFSIRLEAQGATWRVQVISSKGKETHHFPAALFGTTFSTIIPLAALDNPTAIRLSATAELRGEGDQTADGEYQLDQRDFPHVQIQPSNASSLLSSNVYFNRLSKTPLSFSVRDEAGRKINDNIEFVSSNEKKLKKVETNIFQGVSPGFAIIFARINNCYLVPEPLIMANGLYLLE